MSHIMSAQDLEKWDKLLSWDKVQQEIGDRLRNSDKYDDSTTLYYGPQLCHTLRNPASIKCMTHFPSKVGDVFVSYYRMGIQDQFSIWTLKSTDSGVTIENQRFDINGDVKAFLFVPKHRAYLCFCSDLVMRVFTDAHSKCVETNDQQCLTTIRCMAYNRETDEIYIGGIGVLQKWKINGAEHSAVAEPGEVFDIDIQEDEWVIDIKVDPRNKQLMAVTYEGIFVVNYETMKQTHHLQNRHENSLRCCCFYKDREYFITGGGDGAVKVWNAVVFTQVHVFHGHRSAITGLQTHKIDPLLFSSSLDGSVQIWRMDNFSKFMRLDLAEKIYSMKLLNEEEFYCQTETQIKVYSLNQFYNLFAPVESSVYKLQLCQGSQGQPSRIIASTEDGSVRLFSPVTGASLTIIYPMPTFQVLSCFAYSREKNQLHSVLQHGEILIFNCGTNPCRAVERWIPQNNDEEVSQIVQLTLEYQKDEAMITDTIILGGLANGQISLLDASKCVMVKNLQAHIGNITCMETGTDIGETGFKLMETSRKLATGGADGVIRVWELSVNEGILYDNIVFQMMVKIPCVGMPKHISMYENTLSVSTSDKADRGKLHMYRMDGVDKEIQITTLQHPNDEDHTGMITAIDKCPLLGLFATASEDGFIKIWNRHNQLIREMSFGEPMHGLCFANVRGDILFGFQNHICTIPLTSYFPRNYLERITRQEFKDETRELPLAYNHKIKPWFDPNKVPKFSVSLDRRTEEKKAAEDVKVLDNRGSFPREVTLIEDFDDEEHLQNIEDHILLSDRIASPAIARKTVVKFASDIKSRPSTAGEGDIEEEAKAYQFRRRFSAPDPPVKKMKIEKAKEERRRSFSLYMDKLSPWERDLYNKQPIIAPDGYIPNSVVRKRIGYSSPKVRRRKDTWTIDSVKVPPPAKMVYKPQAPEEEDHWEEVKARYLQFLEDSSTNEDQSSSDEEEPKSKQKSRGHGRPKNNGRGRGKKKVKPVDSDDDIEFDSSEPVEDTDIFPPGFEAEIGQDLVGGPFSLLRPGSDLKDIRPFSWGDSQEGRRSTDYTPWRKMQTFMRATSTLSNRSTGSSKMKGSRRSTPTTPGKYELKSKRFDFHKVDLDLGTPDRMRRSLGTKSRERTKSFRLTNMVVDEQSTSVTFKDGSRSGLGHRKGMLPAVDMDIIRRLLAEEFFPDLQGNESFDLIMQNLIRLLDTEDAELHSQICAYIIAIHNEIGIPDHYLDRIVSKLSVQLKWESVPIRRNALRVLRAIGADRQDVLALLLPMLVSSEEDLRDEAKETLAYLAGIENKDELHELMESLGMIQPHFDSKEDEEEALKALAMRLDVPYRSESFTDWINNWVDDTSSIYDSDSEIGLNDIGKAWDGRQHKYKQESLYMTEAASRASTRLRELTFLSKGSPTRELSGLSTLSGYDGYSTDVSQGDGDFTNKMRKINGRNLNTKTLFHELDKRCSEIKLEDFDNKSENETKILAKDEVDCADKIIEEKVVLNCPELMEEVLIKLPNGSKEDDSDDIVSKGDNSGDCVVNGTPIQELDETIAVPGMEGDGVEPQESVQKTGFEAKTDWYNGRAEGYKSGVDKFHEKEKSCGKNPDGSKEMADLSNGKGVGKGAKVFVDGHSRSSDGGSVRSDLVEKGSEICDEKGKGLTDMYKKRHKESVLFEEISDGYQQWEKVSRSEDNRYKKGWGHDLERSEGQQKIGGGYHDATERRRSYGDKGRAEGYDKRSRENIEEGKNKNRSVGHEEKKGEFKNKKSKGEHRLADVKDRSKGCRFPPIKDNRKGNRTKTDGQLTDRSCKSGGSGGFNFRSDEVDSSNLPRQGFLTRDEPILHPSQREDTTYSSEEGDRFDPRDPNLYKYYKNRHRREKFGGSIAEIDDLTPEDYRALNRLYSKQLQGDGEDVDSQIGSMDSLSQVGDVMSTIDSGIMSMQDSGIGRDMSDTQSYRSHRISPFISKEKIQLKPVSSIKGRKDSKRSNSHRRYNLSPVKSSSTIGGVSDRTTPSREKEPDWMKFFQTPTALERKRMEMVKKDFQEGNMKPGTAATINYISDKLPSLPGEAGLRLLKSVKVGKNKDSLSPEEKHHKIESIPGKLSVHTRDEDKGQAKFGILEMQWTTSIPVPLQRTPYTDRYSPLSDVTSTLGGSTVIDYPSKKRLPRIVEKYGRSTRSDTEQFPDIPGAIPTPDFQWDYPIPPPPPKESRISIPYIKKEHDNYCKYYTLVKKKMQNYTSVKNDDHSKDQPLPQIEVKKALPERLKLPKEITQLSRTSSMIVPPITLNQLMSARV